MTAKIVFMRSGYYRNYHSRILELGEFDEYLKFDKKSFPNETNNGWKYIPHDVKLNGK